MASDIPCSVMFYSTLNGGDAKPLMMLVSKGNASSQQRCRETERETSTFLWGWWQALMPLFHHPSEEGTSSHSGHLTVSKDSPLSKTLVASHSKGLFLQHLHPKHSWKWVSRGWNGEGPLILCCHPKTPRESMTELCLAWDDGRSVYPSFLLQVEATGTPVESTQPGKVLLRGFLLSFVTSITFSESCVVQP